MSLNLLVFIPITSKYFQIEFQKSLEKILFKSDKEQLSRVFFNLIKNSIESIQKKAEKSNNFAKKIFEKLN